MAWDDIFYRLPHDYVIEEEPCEVKIMAWNDDETYSHSIVIGLTVEVPEGDRNIGAFFDFLKRGLVPRSSV